MTDEEFMAELVRGMTEPVEDVEEGYEHYGCIFLIKSPEEVVNSGTLQIPDHL